jgi:hypothetical protein
MTHNHNSRKGKQTSKSSRWKLSRARAIPSALHRKPSRSEKKENLLDPNRDGEAGSLATSLIDDVEGAVHDVVKLEGVVRLREALEVQRVVLQHRTRRKRDEILSPHSEISGPSEEIASDQIRMT